MTVPQTIIGALTSASQIVWPVTCLICDGVVEENEWHLSLCRGCTNEITNDKFEHCPRCSSNIGPHTDIERGCTKCRGESFQFRSATRMGYYDGKLREAIIACKRPGGDILAESLGILLGIVRSKEIAAYDPQVLVPVPLHWSRWWERGFNQCELIAQGLSRVLGVPVVSRSVRRTRHTEHQTLKTRAERKRNVENLFRVRKPKLLENMRVLLIDDVITTGATADAVSRVIRAAGATEIDVAVLAHR